MKTDKVMEREGGSEAVLWRLHSATLPVDVTNVHKLALSIIITLNKLFY